ncbi:hypothetical protein [Methylocella sp.]|uniref:hypothetical protein n=1 Tax=Methylocella sp. TaxID=1978226 RepID=UPI003C19E36D
MTSGAETPTARAGKLSAGRFFAAGRTEAATGRGGAVLTRLPIEALAASRFIAPDLVFFAAAAGRASLAWTADLPVRALAKDLFLLVG